jgi:hypothetical protein
MARTSCPLCLTMKGVPVYKISVSNTLLMATSSIVVSKQFAGFKPGTVVFFLYLFLSAGSLDYCRSFHSIDSSTPLGWTFRSTSSNVSGV